MCRRTSRDARCRESASESIVISSGRLVCRDKGQVCESIPWWRLTLSLTHPRERHFVLFYVLSFHLSMIMFVLGQLSVLVLAVQLTGYLYVHVFPACIPGKQINDWLIDWLIDWTIRGIQRISDALWNRTFRVYFQFGFCSTFFAVFYTDLYIARPVRFVIRLALTILMPSSCELKNQWREFHPVLFFGHRCIYS